MRIGILQTGRIPEELSAVHGEYPGMVARLLGGAVHGAVFRSYAVLDDEFPASPDECAAWAITGSKHGVYDPLPWIPPLKAFLRKARAAGRPIVGICFGHQIMAEAFGGRADKSDRGWGVGVHRYRTRLHPSWMADAPAETAFHAMHQDQVTAIPEDATVLADSPFCPYAMLAYGDPERPDAISLQPHPEYERSFAEALIRVRSGKSVPTADGEAALATFGQPVDGDAFAVWVARYLAKMAGTAEAPPAAARDAGG